MKMHKYMQDGANYQARAVLAFLQVNDGIEASWNDKLMCYESNIDIARWENCREQGYIVSMRDKTHKKQLNIIFFEHRNGDSICAVKWKQMSMNSLTIDTAKFGNIYKDKYDTSYDVGHGEVFQMATWIWQQFEGFWL